MNRWEGESPEDVHGRPTGMNQWEDELRQSIDLFLSLADEPGNAPIHLPMDTARAIAKALRGDSSIDPDDFAKIVRVDGKQVLFYIQSDTENVKIHSLVSINGISVRISATIEDTEDTNAQLLEKFTEEHARAIYEVGKENVP